MQMKTLAVATLAAVALSACYTRPVVVNTPEREVMVAVPVPEPYPVPAPAPNPDTMSIHDRVHAAVNAGMGSAASGVNVRVDGSKVYLTGHVGSKADRERAHALAHGTAGVTMVDYSGLMVH